MCGRLSCKMVGLCVGSCPVKWCVCVWDAVLWNGGSVCGKAVLWNGVSVCVHGSCPVEWCVSVWEAVLKMML